MVMGLISHRLFNRKVFCLSSRDMTQLLRLNQEQVKLVLSRFLHFKLLMLPQIIFRLSLLLLPENYLFKLLLLYKALVNIWEFMFMLVLVELALDRTLKILNKELMLSLVLLVVFMI